MKLKGSFTVEAAYVVSIVLLTIACLINTGIKQTGETTDTFESCADDLAEYLDTNSQENFLRGYELINIIDN